MGKKHKKHKSEKHAYEEYPEKPLRLVLKVAGSEVTELSTGSSGHDTATGDDRLEHERHRDKKKKKKKKGEKERSSPAPSLDEKRKKKFTKKKRGQDSVDTDWEEREQCQTPVRCDVPQEKHLTPSVAKIEEKEQSPLQEALSQLIRQLQRKDPSAFFSFPVTDFIAPGYSMIIKKPMDFSTMKEKVKKDQYQSLEELKEDFKIMCENAMIYNKPETIYYKAAKKLLHSGLKILSQERLQSLKQSIDFMADLENTNTEEGKPGKEGSSSLDLSRDGQLATDTTETPQSPRRISKDTPRQDKDSKEESLRNGTQAERELEEIRKIIDDSGGKLSNRELQSELEFERRKTDGTTTLGILNSVELTTGDTGYCPVKLGMMVGRLQSGINTLQGFKEDKRNKVTPVAYMNYGPFSSYAPVYDSSLANVSKEDSDLIYSFYGDESSLQGSESISEFMSKTEEHMSKLADNILDALTNGEHSKSLPQMEMTTEEGEDPAEEAESANDVELIATESSNKSSLAPLSSVKELGLGLDVDSPTFDSEEARQFQQKLDETTLLLQELQEVQNERLSLKPPPNIICLLAPSTRELQLAERVTGNLMHLTSQVTPGDVSSVYGIRKAMGISLPVELVEENHIDLTTESDTPEPVNVFPASEEDTAIVV